MKKSYDVIDFMKLIFAFFVVAIHTELLHGLNPVAKWAITSLFFRIAVPFFMIVSGFFLGIKIRKTGFQCIKQYRKKLYPVFFFYCTISTVLNAVVLYHNSYNLLETIIKSIQNYVFYPKGAMWFILALIVSSFILEYVLRSKVDMRIVLFVSFVLYLFALICNNYYFCIGKTFLSKPVLMYLQICVSARNGVFLFIYMLIGYLISSDQLRNTTHKKTVIFTFFASFILLVCEVSFLYDKPSLDDRSLFLSALAVVPSMILTFSYLQTTIKNHLAIRNISTVVYYTHPIFSLLFGVYLGVKDGIFKFTIVSCLSLLIWFVTRSSHNKYVMKFLR